MLFELLGKKGLYAVFSTSKSDRLFRLIKSSIHRTERRVCGFFICRRRLITLPHRVSIYHMLNIV